MKKLSIFLILMAFFAPLAMNAQVPITIGTGTNTQNASPMNHYWNYSLTEMIYTSDEIADQNPVSNTITHVGFQLANNFNGKTYTIAIYMKNIDESSFSSASWKSLSASDQVFSGTVTASSSGWVTLQLNSPFSYDNTKNLLIGVNKTAGGYAGYTYTWYYTTTSAYQHLEKHNDDNAYSITSMPSSPTRDYKRPNVQLTFSTMPTIRLSHASATVITGSTQALTATTANVTGTPSISYSSSNTSVATVSGSGTTATVTAVAPGTATITATMTVDGTPYTAQCAITVEDPSYCTPAPSSMDASGITNVAFGIEPNNVNNATTMDVNNKYLDCTSEIGAVQAGVEAEVAITYGHSYTYGTFIWVDLNQDYDFEDEGEILYYGQSAGGNSPHTLTANITIPATTTPGDYRMRIGGSDSGFDGGISSSNPCYTGTWAAFQDYTLRVLAAPSCLTPTNLTVTAYGNSVTATWDGAANTYNIKINGTLSSDNPITGNSYTFTGNFDTTYSVEVQTNCDGGETSEWTNPQSTTTDLCAASDLCTISYSLTDRLNDSWNGAQIDVVDATTNTILTTITMPYVTGPLTGSFNICNGRTINFVWTAGYYPRECGFVFTNINGEEILNHAIGSAPTVGNLLTYTVDCGSCPKPTNLQSTTVGANSIALSWTGDNDSYEVRYIKTLPTTDFEEGLGAWTTIDADGDGFTWLWSSNSSGTSGYGESDNCAYSQSYDNDGGQVLYPDNYLVSPKVQLGGTISFYACAQDADWPAEHFGVAVSTTNNTSASAFTTIEEWTMTSDGTPAKTMGSWGHYTVDLSAYSGEGYVAIRHFDCSDKFYLNVDDITITVPDNANWSTTGNTITGNSYVLNNLKTNTTYAIQVRGYCQGEPDPSNWSRAITETTINGYIFQTAGNWNVAANWAGGEVPAAGSDVIIAANVTVPAEYVADASNITFENSATITVADGGQLKTTASGVNATMQKTILGYGAENAETKLGYYLIANPVIDDLDPDTDLGMITGEYDLYYFDLNCDGTYGNYGVIETEGTDGNEWHNYESAAFDLTNGQGYLYANEDRVDLAFTGELNPTNANIKVLMHYSENAEFPGINLLGNPFTCNAYIADGRNFYVVNSKSGDLIESSGAIAPMQGVFVEATAIGNLNFTTTAPANNSKSALNINLTRQNTLIDRAAVNFGEGEGLVKFQLNPNHTKVYMPVEGKDYAVVSAEEQGEMPVNFKAEKNGIYTLSFTTEEISFGYLHLIDNMIGNDVDLLATPSYSFEAKTTDYESRFKLVFATGNADDTFAFYSNGSFAINNEGNATLQVIDINGRILKSESINGCANINVNAAQGIYMLRLVNGDNVKVQKVVVR